MKTGAIFLGLLSVASFLLTGCGKPSASEELANQGATFARNADGGTSRAYFANQCPYGSQTENKGVKLELWDCPVAEKLQLSEPIPPLLLQADCTKKILTVRTADRSLDFGGEVMPDLSFYFVLDSGIAKFKTDGTHNNCQTNLEVEMWGKLDCKDRDKAVIKLEAVWWPGKVTDPKKKITGNVCSVPASCYFHTKTNINQCQ